jgi:cation:H+ antiporter
MIFPLILLAAGLVLVVKAADFLVNGASSLAKRLRIPEMVIGLTIVAFGTSAPELVVNVFSSIAGKSELVLGNVIGSNVCNTLLILGVAGLIYPLNVQRNSVRKEIPFSFLVVLNPV